MRNLWVALLVTLVTCAAFGQMRRPVVAPNGTSLNGEWIIHLTPSLTSKDGQPIDLPATLADLDGTIYGRAGMITLEGVRIGSDVTLEAHHIGTDDRDQLATMKLTIESPQLMTGISGHWITAREPELETMHVAMTRKYSLTMPAAAASLGARGDRKPERQNLASDICHLATDWVGDSFWLGTVSNFASACDVSRNGGGYYVWGDTGPGPDLLFTSTTYVATEWAACTGRTYNFTIRTKGQSFWPFLTEDKVSPRLKKFAPSISYEDLMNLKESLKLEFRDPFLGTVRFQGDFALAAGQADRGDITTLYVFGDCNAIQKSALYSLVYSYLDNGHLQVMCGGSEFHDQFWLRRNPVIVPGCNSLIAFEYIIGSIGVEFD